MTTEATIEKAKAVIEEMRELLAKLEADKTAPRRNWPERVEAGMVFLHLVSGETYITTNDQNLVCVMDGLSWAGAGNIFAKQEASFTYIGHARDILTIRTDAHEPTGAELVGKVCEVSEDGIHWHGPWGLESYWRGRGWSWGSHDTWYKYARLAR